MPKTLGRREPKDWTHVEKYPLTANLRAAVEPPTAIIAGTNWYSTFDEPVKKDGAWWIGLDPKRLGYVRGGHSFAIRPAGIVDPLSWWVWFNQISEGICVWEAICRAVAFKFRVRCQPRPGYDGTQLIDEFDDTPPAEGTSVRAGLNYALHNGLITAKRGEPQRLRKSEITRQPDLFPLASYHWITQGMEQAADVLSLTGKREYVVFVNSWGKDYPHLVRMPLATLERLQNEDGELGVPIFNV